MYNCLRFCRRLINPYTLEAAVDQVIRQNDRIYPNRKLIPRYYNAVSSIFKNHGFGSKERDIPERLSNYNELVSYISNVRRLPVEQISQLFTTIENDNLTEKQVLALLECCNTSVPSDNITNKQNLCRTVLNKFESTGNFSEKVYQSYIIICTENKQCLDVKSLISSLGSNVTQDILKLLLKNVCECGDTEKALQILSEMKSRSYTLDEEVFNYLILAHAIQGGLSSALKIVQTMNMAKIKESSDSYFFLIKGLFQRHDINELKKALEKYKISYSEYMILCLLDVVGFKGNYEFAKLLTKYVNRSILSRNFVAEVQKLCADLIHNNKFDAAFEIYKVFVEPEKNVAYGSFILNEMLLCSAPVEKIVEFAKELKNLGINEYALENVTGIALKNKLFKQALHLFGHLDVVKPHYFWPLLIVAQLESGEIGILDIVQTAKEMNVKFDSESFNMYIFPKCNLRNPTRVINVFQEMGYTVRELLTPVIVALLKRKDFRLANEVWDAYKDVAIDPNELMAPLSITWLSTVDHKECVAMLKKIAETHGEKYVATFLIDMLNKMRNMARMKYVAELLRELKKNDLKINSATADAMWSLICGESQSTDKYVEVETAINDLIDYSIIPTVQYSLHPKDMTVDQLETHLIELKSKGMETRGVLRKLIQKHAGQGRRDRVKELREELAARGYNSSPGMKSAVMHSHVQEGDLEEAMEIYEELMKSSSPFKMDVFKVIDLARLLVKKDQYDRAIDVLKRSAIQHEVLVPHKSWERNCFSLLKSVQDMDLQEKMFRILTDWGYCEPTNVILGSMIQLHLEKDTLENTANMFVDITKKYNKTPMQVVLLAEILKAENDEMLQRVLEGVASVHGNTSARTALLAAMCENGLVKQAVAMLQDMKICPYKEIQKRCERWVVTNNMQALQTLLAASKQVPVKMLDVPKIQLCIMQLYSRQNDCDGALAFWKSLVDEEDHVDTEVDNEFCELLSRCKFNSPENLNMKYKIK